MAYSTSTCAVLTIVSLCGVWLFSSLRFYVRLRILRLYLDDIFAILALTCYTTMAGFYLVGVLVHDLGEHTSQIGSPATMSKGIKDLFLAQVFWLLGSGLIKISFALTLLRVVALRLHVFLLYATMAFAGIMTLSTFIFILLSCKPVSYFWTNLTDPTGGTCIDFNIQIRNSYAHGAVMLFDDVVLGVIVPLHVLSGLQMQRNVKISAGILLSLGSLASIATIARVIYTSRINLQQVFYDMNIPFLWGIIELATSIIGTSAATLKPLLIKLRIFKGSSYTTHGAAYELEGTRGTSKNQTIVTITGPDRKRDHTNSSTEEITWDGKEGQTMAIHRTVQFETSTGGSHSGWTE